MKILYIITLMFKFWMMKIYWADQPLLCLLWITSIPKNYPSITVIIFLNLQDWRLGRECRNQMFNSQELPFQLARFYGNCYSFHTGRALDRVVVYNITVISWRSGISPLLLLQLRFWTKMTIISTFCNQFTLLI